MAAEGATLAPPQSVPSVSVPIHMAPTTAVAGPSTANMGALQMIASRLLEAGKQVMSQRRPWTEMADRTMFSKPKDLGEATSRIKRNVGYFKVNYTIFLASVVVIVMLLHPGSLFVLGFLLATWAYIFIIRQEPLVIGGRTYSEREKLLGMTAFTGVVVFFLTNLGSVLAMAVGFGLTGIFTHGAFRVPDDLFLDDDASNGNFLSFLTGGTANPLPVPGV